MSQRNTCRSRCAGSGAIVTTNVVARQPNGSCAGRRIRESRASPSQTHLRNPCSSDPLALHALACQDRAVGRPSAFGLLSVLLLDFRPVGETTWMPLLRMLCEFELGRMLKDLPTVDVLLSNARFRRQHGPWELTVQFPTATSSGEYDANSEVQVQRSMHCATFVVELSGSSPSATEEAVAEAFRCLLQARPRRGRYDLGNPNYARFRWLSSEDHSPRAQSRRERYGLSACTKARRRHCLRWAVFGYVRRRAPRS